MTSPVVLAHLRALRRRRVLARLRKYRGRVPADFGFEPLDANARDPVHAVGQRTR